MVYALSGYYVQLLSFDLELPVTQPQEARYRVVVNSEEQHSLWRADRDPPWGWRDAGGQGSLEDCLAWIRQAWTDIRPRGLRDGMGVAMAYRGDGQPERPRSGPSDDILLMPDELPYDPTHASDDDR
jgi:MbtH protein